MHNSKLAKQMISDNYWNYSDAMLTWLNALEAAGIDNWSGYDEAKEIFKGYIEEEKQNHV